MVQIIYVPIPTTNKYVYSLKKKYLDKCYNVVND